MTLSSLIHSHAGFAYLSLILLLTRGVLSAKAVDWRKYKILTISPHLIDTLLIGSGLTIVGIYLSDAIYSLSELVWLLPKLLFLGLYVVFSIKAFKKQQPFSIKHFCLAVLSFMLAICVVVFH